MKLINRAEMNKLIRLATGPIGLLPPLKAGELRRINKTRFTPPDQIPKTQFEGFTYPPNEFSRPLDGPPKTQFERFTYPLNEFSRPLDGPK